ncbi:MAG TPA: zinc-dependent alcohol dehydrogenase family protein [Gryllotalpicola sp.]
MKAWAAITRGRIERVERAVPDLAAGEVLVLVQACGVCRTDLHVVDREIPVHRPDVIPGHQIVGRVVELGPGVTRLAPGDLVGVAWLRHSCGACEWCRSGRENLCELSRFTGWDEDGGFAEYAIVAEAFAYALPRDAEPVRMAPLLCAGIIGYRALERAELPAGGRLGIYGFGSSAHITAAIARAQGAEVYVMTRGQANRRLAASSGATFVGVEDAVPPVPLDAAIVFAPAGGLVPVALSALTRGGTAVLAGIHMTDIPAMDYTEHLFYEKDLRTVTANTRADGAALLRLAQQLEIVPSVTTYGFDRVDAALDDLRAGRSSGSLVIDLEFAGNPEAAAL